MIFFSYPKFFLSGICGSASLSKAEFLFLKPLLTLVVAIFVSLQMLYLYFFSPSLHAFSPSLAYSQSRTQPSTQQLIRPFSRTCDTRSRTPGPAHRGGRGWCPIGRGGVSLEEMNLAPQH